MIWANSPFLEALQRAPILLDGGLGTRLATRGNDTFSQLWSAQVLLQHPAEIQAAHVEFFQAGARVAITSSYQVSESGFQAEGLDHETFEHALRHGVELARTARAEAGLTAEQAWILASVGPYGASLGDGSEYTGAYGPMLDVAELRHWHRERLQILADTQPDALLCETIPNLAEVQALTDELLAIEVPAIMSMSVTTDATGTIGLRSGDCLRQAVAYASTNPHLIAIGVNCCEPAHATAALREIRDITPLPLIVYPNTGEYWDPHTHEWSGDHQSLLQEVPVWLELGARLIGGCCRVDTAEIAQMATIM